MLYKRFLEAHPQDQGIVVTTKSDFSSNFGFGSSSAVTVAFAKALTELYGFKLSNKELFDLCYQAVIDVQGVGSGFDIAAAIWGGTIYYVSPAKVVVPMTNGLPLVVGYTGIKADTPTLVRMVDTLKIKQPEKINRIFDSITQLVERAKKEIADTNWLELGRLFNQNQILLQELGVSSVELDRLVAASTKAHAFGAKLSGAGGGDCMVAVTDNSTQTEVEQAIVKAGGEIMHVKLHAEGV
jgi:mevalonate kinase